MDEGRKIIGAGAGSGLAAKAMVDGGVDLLVVYNSGYFRSHGLGSLAGLMPFDNANRLSYSVGGHVLAVAGDVPVICGLCAQDPTFWVDRTLEKVVEMGFAGVQNFPTVGLIDADSYFRRGLEETGLGYDKEVEMVARAHKMGLLTTPYVFTPDEAVAMTKTGSPVIVIHLGLTVSSDGGKSCKFTLDSSVPFIQEMVDIVHGINEDCIILVHGGPLHTSKDFQFVENRVSGIAGFYGASSFERHPPYTAIKATMEEFRK